MAQARTYSPVALRAAQLLGNRIALSRRERRWTAAELAARVGVTEVTLRKVERGDMTVRFGVALEAAALCGVPLFDEDPERVRLEQRNVDDRLALLPRPFGRQLISMTTSEPRQAFVWAWLPGASTPVVAGRLRPEGSVLTFTYGASYLERKDAIALYLPELPLGRGPISPLAGELAGCIADAAPDAWGRRVILNRAAGGGAVDTEQLDVFTYLLESGSNRIGALDFQRSTSEYLPRTTDSASVQELAESADRVEAGILLSPALDSALIHGSSVGGARPKAILRDGDRELIAKFSSSTDSYPVVLGEFVAMRLADQVALDVAPVALERALGKDVLLVERFDRPGGGRRRQLISALTMLGLDEMSGRYASYAELADLMRGRFADGVAALHELFARITFNILTGNNDDHARNHAAFWDGEWLRLTPAYDICPQLRAGGETAQAMAIGSDGWRMSQLIGCVERAATYRLTEHEAREIIDHQVATIRDQWGSTCDQAGLSDAERDLFWGRQFLNPYAFYGY